VPADEGPRSLPWVSPLRDGGVRGRIAWRLGRPAQVVEDAMSRGQRIPGPDGAVAGPGEGLPEPDALRAIAPDLDEPALPDEAAAAAVADAEAGTQPLAALPGQALHVRFQAGGSDVVVAAARTVRDLVHDHPGETPVVLHVPAPGGAREMLLQPRVAYDEALLADVRRRLGERLVRIELT
jgi:hypothetical protein